MKKALLAPVSQALRFKSGQAINVTTEDAMSIASALENEFEFDYLVKASPSVPVRHFSQFSELEWSFEEYDTVVCFVQSPLFFGGAVTDKQVKYVKALCEYEGNIVFHYADPMFNGVNYLQKFVDRVYSGKPIKHDKVDPAPLEELVRSNTHKADVLLNECWTIWPNLSAPVHRGLEPVRFVDSLRHTFSRVRSRPGFSFDQPVEGICYAGMKRPERTKALKDLGIDPLKIRFVGSVAGGKAIPTHDVSRWMSGFTHTLILGDPGHYNCGLNHRLLQGMFSECVCLIDARMDGAETMLPKDLAGDLRDQLMFTDGEDMMRKYQCTLRSKDDIINRQNEFMTKLLQLSPQELTHRCTI